MSDFDVVIAGGGIVGAACAERCTRAGMRVALVEREVIGGGATGAGMGHVVVMSDTEAHFALTRHSQLLWHELSGELPPSAEYAMAGTLWVAADSEEMAEAERKHAYHADRELPGTLLSARELAEQEPNLREGLAGALLVPEDAVVNQPIVAMHLARKAEAGGATLMLGNSVASMGAGEVVLDDGTRLRAPRLVNATGAWSPEITGGVPVRKRKGHLVVTERYPGFVRHQLVELGYLKSAHSQETASVAFNVQPRKSGHMLIGSSRQYDESTGVDEGVLAAMMQRAGSYLPGVSSLSTIRVTTGFRAATPDKLPLIGPSPADASVWLATGHEGLGITTSLGTADLLTAMLTGKEPEIPVEPYLPARFTGKEQPCSGEA